MENHNMSETTFKKKVEKFLKEYHCWQVKYWGGGAYTKAGVPDLLVCCNGFFLGVELKAAKGKPSDLQMWNVQKIREAGGIAIILYPSKFYMFQDMIKDLANDREADFWRKHQTFFD